MHDIEQGLRDSLRAAANNFDPDASLSLAGVHHRARILRTEILVWVLVLALIGVSGAFFGLRAARSDSSGSFVDPRPNHGSDPHFKIARAETVWLLNRFTPPAGAIRVDHAPSAHIAGGPPSSAAATHFIYTTRYWTVSQPYESVKTSISGRVPHGLVRGDYGYGGGPDFTTSEYEFEDRRPSPAFEDAQLEISIVSISPNVTGLRADGTAIWLSSEPTRVTETGPRLHLTIAGGCPRSLAVYKDVSNDRRPELLRRMLPSASPVAGLTCLYKPATSSELSPEVLTTFKQLDAAAARTLQRQISAIPVGSPGVVAMSCPYYRATEILVFRYPDSTEIDIWHSMVCGGSYDNGFIIVG